MSKPPCFNCDTPIPVGREPPLYCSTLCQKFAETVRYARRVSRDGRMNLKDVQDAIRIRKAWVFSGQVYTRTLSAAKRREVFQEKGHACLKCGLPAKDIDHIDPEKGDEMENLQPLCSSCHMEKSLASLGKVSLEQLFDPSMADYLIRMLDFDQRVAAQEPMRRCDNDVSWPKEWQALAKQQRRQINVA